MMASGTGITTGQPLQSLDYLVILDLEAVNDDPADPLRPEIVEFPWLVYDLNTRMPADHKQLFIAPTFNTNPNPPPDAVKRLGIDVAFSSSLRDAIFQFDSYIFSSFIMPRRSFCLLTDGPWDLADLLFNEAARKAVVLAPHFGHFLNLRSEFSKCYPTAPMPTDRRTMFAFLDISTAQRASGLDECVALANVVTLMLRDGHVWGPPQLVPDFDFHATIPAVASAVASAVPVGGIIRLRGLPWTCTEQDVLDFLTGLTVVPSGVHFVRNAMGKATGEAFVQLESLEAVNAALGRHKEMMGKRYIEVFKSSPGDMYSHLGRVEMRRGAGAWKGLGPAWGITHGGRGKAPTYIVKVLGIPRDAGVDDILRLFDGLEMAGEGIHLVRDPGGTFLGEAFVELTTEAWAKKAVTRTGTMMTVKGGETGVRVEIRKSSAAQLKAAFGNGNGIGKKNVSGGGRNGDAKYYVRIRNVSETVGTEEIVRMFEEFRVGDEDIRFVNKEGVGNGDKRVGFERSVKVGFASKGLRDAALAAKHQNSRLGGVSVVVEDGGFDGKRGAGKASAGSSGNGGDVSGNLVGKVVRMRGLPYSSTDEDIVEFFEGYEIAEGGISRGKDRHGRPSGEAWVTFNSVEDAREVVIKLDKAHMGKRYIELML